MKANQVYIVEHFLFEDKESYERAQKEAQVIAVMRKKYKLSNGKVALKVYEKAVEEGVFSTVVGYTFLKELRAIISKTQIASLDDLPGIPVRGEKQPVKVSKSSKFELLYENQKLTCRKLKYVIVALVVLLLTFVIIDLKSEYSVFTYFTNYKAQMEEELINKYEKWEHDLETRENALKQTP